MPSFGEQTTRWSSRQTERSPAFGSEQELSRDDTASLALSEPGCPLTQSDLGSDSPRRMGDPAHGRRRLNEPSLMPPNSYPGEERRPVVSQVRCARSERELSPL